MKTFQLNILIANLYILASWFMDSFFESVLLLILAFMWIFMAVWSYRIEDDIRHRRYYLRKANEELKEAKFKYICQLLKEIKDVKGGRNARKNN